MNYLHHVVRNAILLLAIGPLVYYVLATVAAWRFFRRPNVNSAAAFTPPVSVLKPIRGVDFGSYENFSSFCKQNYPDYEVLFGINDESDPALPLLRRVIEENPSVQIRVLIGSEPLGANKKVCKLAQLAREAQHEVLVMSDGDVRVGPNYLRETVAPFAKKETGVVTAFYRGIAEENLGAKLEAIGASGDFFAGVVMAQATEGISFALGASVATTKHWFAKIGGFEAIADYLADDYEIGHRIAEAGGKVILSHEPVWTMYPAQTASGYWQHQLRWARTVRLCRPLSYFGLIFTQGLPWSLLAAAAAPRFWIGAAYLVAYLFLRFVMAWMVGVSGVGDDVLRKNLWLLPVRDLAYFVVWLASFGSNRVHWNGIEYRVERGRLIAVDSGRSAEPANATHVSR